MAYAYADYTRADYKDLLVIEANRNKCSNRVRHWDAYDENGMKKHYMQYKGHVFIYNYDREVYEYGWENAE